MTQLSQRILDLSLPPLTSQRLQIIILRLKVPGWRLWAYIDGSCLTYKSHQCVGAGVHLRQKQPSMLTLAELG